MGAMFEIPNLCPVCAGPTTIEGDFLFCRSKNCSAKLSGDIIVWVRNLGLLHWGDAFIDAICNHPSVKSVADLYKLSIDDMATATSGIKMARKCYGILHDNKDVTLELVLSSLNIPNFGLSTATDLVHAGYDTVESILNISYDDLICVPNIGEKTAMNIQEGIIAKRDLIIELDEVLNIKKPAEGPLQGKTICITGELSMPRKTVEKKIIDAGGYPKSSVSKTTSYLVTNNPGSGSSKLKKAQKYGISIISENELLEIMNP